ncbi:DNA-binding protein [Sphingobacterium sp. DN00404]|uniref:DNA-binding protein n=1 Tax=Sphingobacterium micropteri TaxID=2763501 RepID=A0ABR7YT10_9SPHI|nr:DNA-binding protein [Sphingobacterium micropteri]MBD1434415.1 DNA-binding protein [Sphingobacterium micropteri]
MTVFKYIDRINLLDKLIRQRRTGTPLELAKRLGISVSRLYVILDDLKDRGAPIGYSRQSLTYYYEYEFSISISVKIEILDDSKLRHISAGQRHFSNILFTTFFV